MRKILPVCLVFLPMVAGCLAAAGEGASAATTIRLTWETLLTIYGPMAVWLIWFIRRDDLRRREDAEHRREWTELVKNNTEALANATTALTLSRTDDEKNRLAVHKLSDEVREACVRIDGLCTSLTRATRVVPREE